MASVAPTVTSTSVSASYSMPKCRLRWAAMAWRSGAIPIPGGYWLAPSAMASCAAFSNAGGPSSSGNPWPRFTAPIRAARADISANTVVVYGRSRDTVMVVEPRTAVALPHVRIGRGEAPDGADVADVTNVLLKPGHERSRPSGCALFQNLIAHVLSNSQIGYAARCRDCRDLCGNCDA